MLQCYKCGEANNIVGKPGFQDICDSCQSYLHCCMNCRFYIESSDQCNESQAEWLSDRLTFNRCEYYQLKGSRGPTPQPKGQHDRHGGTRFKKADWRNVRKDENLFPSGGGGRSNNNRADQARRGLDDLFK